MKEAIILVATVLVFVAGAIVVIRWRNPYRRERRRARRYIRDHWTHRRGKEP